MKNLLLGIAFISGFSVVSAQEIDLKKDKNATKKEASGKSSTSSNSSSKHTISENDKLCYGETSKVAFYEVLIANNGFNIELKNSKDLVLRDAKEMVSKKQEETLYSEED